MKSALIRLIKNPVKFFRTSIVPKFYGKYPYLRYTARLSDEEMKLVTKLQRYNSKWDSQKPNVVLMQMVEDYAFVIKLSATASHLAKKHNANIALYSVAAKIERKGYPASVFFKLFFKEKTDRIHAAISENILFRNTDDYADAAKIEKEYQRIIASIKNKYDVISISIEGMQIGDLIYDTYLRFANKPTLDINDSYFKQIVREAIQIYYVSDEQLKKHKVVALVNTYTTYIHHGIITRLCTKYTIPVYNPMCGFISLVHKVHPNYQGHRNNHFLYRHLFNKLPNKAELIKEYKEKFEKRFKGEIDGATFYMKESAFSANVNKELNDINWNKTVVILAHCFFDSPHIYRDLIFPDFYEWMQFTLTELQKQSDLTILVKAHPNGLPQNDEIFDGLKEKYKNTNIRFIDKKTSQLQIINSKPKAIITAYGTAAAEFAYFNIPVLTIYDNPFTDFNFTHLANSINEYKEKLANITNLSPIDNKEEVIEYYYMHNYFYLNGRDSDYLQINKYKSDTSSDIFLKDYLPKMDEAYFKLLETSIEDGFKLIEFESEVKL